MSGTPVTVPPILWQNLLQPRQRTDQPPLPRFRADVCGAGRYDLDAIKTPEVLDWMLRFALHGASAENWAAPYHWLTSSSTFGSH